MKITICRGAPGSGKSTWARDEAVRTRAIIVNRDTIRRTIDRDDTEPTGYPWPRGKKLSQRESRVTEIHHQMIRDAFEAEYDVICDDTNLSDRAVNSLRAIANEYGATVVFNDDFCSVPLHVLYHRNAARRYSVPESVVRDMYARAKLIVDGPLPINEDLPKCVIVDMDGTLAHMDGRRGPFEWDKVGGDSLDPLVFLALQGLRADGYKIVVMSGRDGECYGLTHRWLTDHDVVFHDLFMRTEGDTRRDDIIKEELLRMYVLPKYNPVLCIDDRRQMVERWRALGLRCWAVDAGEF